MIGVRVAKCPTKGTGEFTAKLCLRCYSRGPAQRGNRSPGARSGGSRASGVATPRPSPAGRTHLTWHGRPELGGSRQHGNFSKGSTGILTREIDWNKSVFMLLAPD